jgi:hypothetical protein
MLRDAPMNANIAAVLAGLDRMTASIARPVAARLEVSPLLSVPPVAPEDQLVTAAELAAVRREIAELRRAARAGNGADTDLVDAVGAAQILGMTPAAVRQAARRGTLPVIHLGRRVRFRRAELAALARRE